MTGAVLLSALVLAVLWWELSGTGPRFRDRLEQAAYTWVTNWKVWKR
jgi:hypothetical protein